MIGQVIKMKHRPQIMMPWGKSFDAITKTMASLAVGILLLLALGTGTVTRNLSHNAFIALGSVGLLVLLVDMRGTFKSLRDIPRMVLIAIALPMISILITLITQPAVSEYDIDLLQRHVFYVVALLALAAIRRLRPHPVFYWGGLLLCVVLSTGFTAAQIIEHGVSYRAAGERGSPIMLADIALASGFIFGAGLISLPSMGRWRIGLAFAAPMFGLFCAMATQTRGALIFAPIGLVLMLMFGRWARFWKTVVISVVLTVFVTISFMQPLSNRFERAVESVQSYWRGDDGAGATSVGARFEMWRAAYAAFLDRPIFGIGSGQFGPWLEQRAAAGLVYPAVADHIGDKPHTHAHNAFMTTLATRGIVGLLALLTFMAIPLWYLLRIRRKGEPGFSEAGLTLVASYSCFALTESVYFHWQTLDFYLIALVATISFTSDHGLREETP